MRDSMMYVFEVMFKYIAHSCVVAAQYSKNLVNLARWELLGKDAEASIEIQNIGNAGTMERMSGHGPNRDI